MQRSLILWDYEDEEEKEKKKIMTQLPLRTGSVPGSMATVIDKLTFNNLRNTLSKVLIAPHYR